MLQYPAAKFKLTYNCNFSMLRSLKSKFLSTDAIDKRHNIYYDTETGTMAAVNFFKALSAKSGETPRIIELDGRPGVKEVSADLLKQLK
jgi:hypothetical protein